MLTVNNGSTDQTAGIAQSFAKAGNRIKLFNQPNIGIFRLAERYNFALDKAKGKYIAILEGDDLWEPDKLSRQVSALDNNPNVVFAWSPVKQANIDRNSAFTVSPALKPSDYKLFTNRPKGSLLEILFFRNCIPALTALIKKYVLQKIVGFKQGYGLPLIDAPTWQLLCTQGEFFYDDKPAGSWRVYPGQTTKTHLVRILSGFYALSSDNFKKFSRDSSLSFAVKQEDIDRHFKKKMIIAYSREGRYLLIRKQYKEARKDYREQFSAEGVNICGN